MFTPTNPVVNVMQHFYVFLFRRVHVMYANSNFVGRCIVFFLLNTLFVILIIEH